MINVLIVEDDPMVAEFNRKYMEQVEGFQCGGWASSVEEAKKYLAEQAIDLILLDVYMQESNGLDLLSFIREAGVNVDVIVISAASDMSSVKKAMNFGAVDYLIKPFHFNRFLEALTGYREHISIVRERSLLSQEELDRLIYHKSLTKDLARLPKGITKSTLAMIWNCIQQHHKVLFSTEDIAESAGISRVSMRKYLAFMTEIEVLSMETIYGTIGRPVYQYQVLPQAEGIINSYI
ncbi:MULTISPECIES: two-component system response regulator DcuR [Paenibacillus]|uniref:two-component system response regulator DcuR n=1 Tax=Paenibacillus TaxID=44249 RepID=UPI000589CC64|nr:MULTISPECIES: two-component system response regulator DcuR [Paenibacillus]AJE53174.1 transcriptional regulator [Paenibacillus polymyxa]AZH30375.1 two-component system response regulator DcuR [Paenibacillus sp. M-152]MBU9705716.1 two-component system response regulator DcuR [Paenibacillus sp. AK121]MEE4569593.1 two-component system response regulator DcuR [Paenibacillus polymyxa]OAZ50154.1 transcriptional regulator [Paenibacillus polymyxa]